MTLRELIQMWDLNPHLSFGRQWSATIESAEIKEGPMLSSLSGYGVTARDALQDMLSNMRGKQIVLHAGLRKHRKEFTCPDTAVLDDDLK